MKKKKNSFVPAAALSLLLLAALIAAVIFISSGGLSHKDPVSEEEGCRVTVLSVGDALCCYMTDGEHSVMIDTGSWQTRDLVKAFLRREGTERLDLLVISHPHADHYGGYIALEDIPVDKVYVSTADDDELYYHDVLDFFRSKGAEISFAPAGETEQIGEDMTFSFLGPLTEDDDLNDMSVVVRLSYKGSSVLFCADMTGDEADSILDRGAVLSSDVYIAAHHGSSADGANSYRLLREVMPDYAVISCAGNHSSHDYPHEAFLSRLEDLDCEIFRTDISGDITFVLDGAGVSFR